MSLIIVDSFGWQVNDAEKLLEAREKELEEVAALLHRTKGAEAELAVKVSYCAAALDHRNKQARSAS